MKINTDIKVTFNLNNQTMMVFRHMTVNFMDSKRESSLIRSAATKLPRQTRVVPGEYKISQKLKSIQDPRPLQYALSLPLPIE